jgi:hypothetical protein
MKVCRAGQVNVQRTNRHRAQSRFVWLHRTSANVLPWAKTFRKYILYVRPLLDQGLNYGWFLQLRHVNGWQALKNFRRLLTHLDQRVFSLVRRTCCCCCGLVILYFCSFCATNSVAWNYDIHFNECRGATLGIRWHPSGLGSGGLQQQWIIWTC